MVEQQLILCLKASAETVNLLVLPAAAHAIGLKRYTLIYSSAPFSTNFLVFFRYSTI
jgi:hypothetical protein